MRSKLLAMVNKTDKLDCRGLNRLQRTGTLPMVWIPPHELRDRRDLPRTRMVFSRECTRLKNRIHATRAKYGVRIEEVSDLFGRRGKELLKQKLPLLPSHTRFATERLLEQQEAVSHQISVFEKRMRTVFAPSDELKLLQSLPGVGFILATVIILELGDIHRFPNASHFASYAGTTPRVYSSGDKKYYGQLRSDINRYLK